MSTEPTTAAWESHFIDPAGALYDSALFDASCPTAEFCAAVGNASNEVLTSKQPLGDEEDWAGAYLESNELLSCPSPSLCLAAGGENISVGTPAPPPAPEGEETGDFFTAPPPVDDQLPIGVPMPPLQSSLRLNGSKQIVVKNGKAIAPISCITNTGHSCTGDVKIFASPANANDGRLVTKSRAARVKIASGKFAIAPNRTKRVAVPLNRRGKALLAAADKAVAQLRIIGSSGSRRPSLRTAVILRAAT